MRRSTERILTTHVGSLARPHDLLQMMDSKESGEPYRRDALARIHRGTPMDGVRKAEGG